MTRSRDRCARMIYYKKGNTAAGLRSYRGKYNNDNGQDIIDKIISSDGTDASNRYYAAFVCWFFLLDMGAFGPGEGDR